MENYLKIGLIVKPQGIKGEVKVQPLTSDICRFKNLKEVYIDNKKVKVLNAKIGVDAVFLALFGVSDRDMAETFRNKYIYVDRENAVELKKDEFFIADLIGCNIKTENEETIGKVVDITSLKTDVFTVLTVDNKIIRFPFLKDLLVKVDVENSFIIVNSKRLQEVSVYED